MNNQLKMAFATLHDTGWQVRLAPRPLELPQTLLDRYSWLPDEWIELLGHVEDVSNAEQTQWLLGALDYRESTDSAFTWNAWEKLCLECAEQDGDVEWEVRIRRFWDEHFPVALSVGSGYAYCALRRSDGKVVHGIEPDFEEATVFADDLVQLVANLPNAW